MRRFCSGRACPTRLSFGLLLFTWAQGHTPAMVHGQVPASGPTATSPALNATQPAATQPASAPAGQHPARVALLVDHLHRHHLRELRSRDWITRSFAGILLARLPDDAVTATLLNHLQNEQHPVARLVFWQAVLAHAGRLSEEQFSRWQGVTDRMIREDLFSGDLRVGLLEMLSSVPIRPAARAYARRVFATTSSLDSADIGTLLALGQAMARWGDADLVNDMLSSLARPNEAVRAELVLQAAGAPVAWTGGHARAASIYREWWRGALAGFVARTPPDGGWKSLAGQFVASPVLRESIDPFAAEWRSRTELTELGLDAIEFVISIDISGSMGDEIDWLRRDIRVFLEALRAVSREPRIGLTSFSGPDTPIQVLSLTPQPARLQKYLDDLQVIGGGEELWIDSIRESVQRNRFSSVRGRNRRVIVVISDEPLTHRQLVEGEDFARKLHRDGFRVYFAKVLGARVPANPASVRLDRTGADVSSQRAPLTRASIQQPAPAAPGAGPIGPRARRSPAAPPAAAALGSESWAYFDQFAEWTGGQGIWVWMLQNNLGLGGPALSPGAVAPRAPGGGLPGRLLPPILTDAIAPSHADAAEPFCRILVSYCQRFARSVPEQRGSMGRSTQNSAVQAAWEPTHPSYRGEQEPDPGQRRRPRRAVPQDGAGTLPAPARP